MANHTIEHRTDMDSKEAVKLLTRVAEALERLAPPPPSPVHFDQADAFVWHAQSAALQPVHLVSRIDLSLLCGIDHVRDILLENTRRFAAGFAANNALLWGTRGMGKSSLVKAVHARVNDECSASNNAKRLILVEIHREDIASLPQLLALLRREPQPFILFCDDLAFESDDASYKALKGALEGGLEGRPENVLFYATSNRRHLMPRDIVENERSTAINPAESVDSKVSLSDRFGLWLGFHVCSQQQYLDIVQRYANHFRLPVDAAELEREALEWAMTRGARSGRVAWQFTQDVAGRLGVSLTKPTPDS